MLTTYKGDATQSVCIGEASIKKARS